MSIANIRVEIDWGTSIERAYFDCEKVSNVLGGLSVETDFNGVIMIFYHQSLDVWEHEYHNETFGKVQMDKVRSSK